MKNLVITTQNIDKVVTSVKKHVLKNDPDAFKSAGFLMPMYTRTGEINRKKYRGIGRPKKTDYVRLNTLKMLRRLANNK